MGFSTLLDIIGSTIIGSTLLLILFRMNDVATENTYTYAGDLIVQQSLVEVVTLVEYDFRKIGYCKDWSQIPDPTQAILFADDHDIKFLTDVSPTDGIVDTIRYYVGPISEASGTSNPRDRILYRIVNNAAPAGSNLGVTQFDLEYYNALGAKIATPVAFPGEIQTMQINITVENTEPMTTFAQSKKIGFDTLYTSVFWRQIRLVARNLRNR